MIAVINKNTTVTALRIALGFLCAVCVASAAETGNISPKTTTVAVAPQEGAKTVARPNPIKRSAVKPADIALTRHSSSFHGPPGPTLAVGARYVRTPTPGLSRLDNFGRISEGEYIYDWPPGAKMISTVSVPVSPAVPPPTVSAVKTVRR